MLHVWPSNPTQWAGIVVFALAAAACWRCGPDRWRRLAAWQAAGALEVLLGTRYALRAVVVQGLQAQQAYAGRQPWQMGLLVLMVLGGLVMGWRLARQGCTPWQAALAAALAQALLFAVEMVSLHGVDTWLYHRAGPLAVIGWLWVGLGAGVVLAALRARALPQPSSAA